MYLYLGTSPRVLYLVTSSHDERLGRPRRALVFRASDHNASQAVTEFLPKDEVDLHNAVRLTNRVVKGCLGLISVDNGAHCAMTCYVEPLNLHCQTCFSLWSPVQRRSETQDQQAPGPQKLLPAYMRSPFIA